MNSKFYLTTTLPYVNAEPHIGHALEFIQADALARYFRVKLGRENVFFNLGTDEHGQKMFAKAEEEALAPQAFVDKYAKRFQDFCALFGVEYDNFYRTSSLEHHKAAQAFWQACDARGDIYKKKYEGLYCVGCECFVTEKELVDGKCPDHQKEPVKFSEENYFFRLSKYRTELLSWLEKTPGFLKPENKLEELKNFIAQAEDISISRKKENLPWGIEVPGDPDQVMYVWFDALTNYVNVVGYATDKKRLKEWWPAVQLCGPDNLRFQGAIWQGMLASAGLPQTRQLLVHGMVLAEDGSKMSKTCGNVVSPFVQAEKYGAEIVRYYLLAGLTTFGDAAYKEDDLVALYNANLADNYGNLLNRVIHLANKKEIGINNEAKVTSDFKQAVSKFRVQAESLFDAYDLHAALAVVNDLANFGNKYIDDHKPWGQDLPQDKVEEVLNNLSYLLDVITDLYEPAIPTSIAKAREALAKRETIILFPKIEVAGNGK